MATMSDLDFLEYINNLELQTLTDELKDDIKNKFLDYVFGFGS